MKRRPGLLVSDSAAVSRHVRGFLFVDYVRIIRAHGEVAWSEHLPAGDLPWLERRIELQEWYPMATYERMGLAILDQVAEGDFDLIHRWGRDTVDLMQKVEPYLIAEGDPRETFSRFDVLRQMLFDFPAVESKGVRDGKAVLEINFGMSQRAEEAACHQSIGFLERLLELSGADEINVKPLSYSWEEGGVTVIEVRWRPTW